MFLSDNAIDVSGTPRSYVCIGLVSFVSHKKTETINEFYKKFPDLKRSKWKAAKLDSKKLQQIVSFLNEKGVRMFAIEFTNRDWNKWLADLGKEALFNERIYAILYYKLLKCFCWRGRQDIEYTITVCEESNLNINSVLDTLRRLCKGGRINVVLNKGRAKYVPTIKFADFVAGSLRKINKRDLEKLTNYKIVPNELQERELTKAFRLEDKSDLKRKLGL
jgi:hypothetical protein